MKAASLKEIREELKHLSQKELIDHCLSLSKFKKENKELITYRLFEAHDESSYIDSIKEHMNDQFDEINQSNYYYIKKGIRKILREAKKYIRYSKKKETEAHLLLHFCLKLKTFTPSIKRSTVLTNIYNKQLEMGRKAVSALHEDLRYDFEELLNTL